MLTRPCSECGFDAGSLKREQIGPRLLVAVHDLASALDRPEVRDRPERDVWSPLEYACHVRDVCRVFDERLVLMLTTQAPLFANWDQDQTAEQERYAAQDPVTVAGDLLWNATSLAKRFGAVTGDQWARTGSRSDGAQFTVLTLGQYLVHDPVHHVYDVTGVRQEGA